jgi:hypothetical protein
MPWFSFRSSSLNDTLSTCLILTLIPSSWVVLTRYSWLGACLLIPESGKVQPLALDFECLIDSPKRQSVNASNRLFVFPPLFTGDLVALFVRAWLDLLPWMILSFPPEVNSCLTMPEYWMAGSRGGDSSLNAIFTPVQSINYLQLGWRFSCEPNGSRIGSVQSSGFRSNPYWYDQ